MKGDFSSNSFYIEKEGGSEIDYSFTVNGIISVSGIDWFLQLGSREGMFFNKSPVETRDACTTINEGTGVDGFQGVRWFNKLDRDLHRWDSFYMNHSTLCTRKNSRQRSFPV